MRKIQYAVEATGAFISHLHLEGFDRGMVATFGDSFRIEQRFTGHRAQLQAALARLSHSIADEGTRLYDSLEDVITEFWRTGMRTRPWLLTVITDGCDTASRKYARDPVAIGRYVAARYNHEPSNLIFFIAVGSGEQVRRRALFTLGQHGGFPTVAIGAFPLLESVLLEIALDASTRLAGSRVDGRGLSWRQVEHARQALEAPIDYAFLIDRSGSMADHD